MTGTVTMQEDATVPAVAYLRVSTGLQAEKGMGLDVQRGRVKEYAAANALELVDVVSEAASGAVREGELFSWEHRPVLVDLLERAKRRKYDTLLVAKFDRLSRDAATLEILGRMLAQHGVTIVSADEDNGDSATAKLLRHTLAGFAEFERALIRERLAAGKAAKRNRGGYSDGRPPYGYRTQGGRLTVDAATAEVVHRIFRDAKDGLGPARIARDLNANGIPAPAGATWHRRTVRAILSNVAYVGELHGIKRAHEPIVSRQLFNAAQTTLEATARD
jgi:site-specific DNA recombinase